VVYGGFLAFILPRRWLPHWLRFAVNCRARLAVNETQQLEKKVEIVCLFAFSPFETRTADAVCLSLCMLLFALSPDFPATGTRLFLHIPSSLVLHRYPMSVPFSLPPSLSLVSRIADAMLPAVLSLFVRWCPRFRSLYIFATGPKDCPMLRAMHSLYHRSRSQEPHAVSMIRNARLDWISPPWYPSLFCSHVDDDDARTGHHPGHRN
jgi:hypothetical protein